MSRTVKLKEQPAEVARQESLAARRERRAKRDEFKDKTFADLTNKQKDDLLKQLAIAAGIISE
jgi:hypothetical protein